ncbi:alpha-ketoglutarate-dependent dioxygenase AlkB family protein [Galbibacter sp.]|uniref:alpha-ketoglutarate-dependent dioxygenase AlkB family protein n=1 Tax=Galbibacter sp. TaxID=2918471 RepID=UPI003A94D6ED
MDLFSHSNNPSENLLPYQGIVNYYGLIMDATKAAHFYRILMDTISWQNDRAIIFGKLIITKREVAWYADQPFSYSYSNTTKTALPWTKELLELKSLVESYTNESFNSCLLNLYHDGNQSMAWHSDAEKDLKENGAIASLSLGAQRKFAFKHKTTKETRAIHLPSGSLLVMKGETQRHWLHRLPPTKKINQPRINLTFRTIDSTKA